MKIKQKIDLLEDKKKRAKVELERKIEKIDKEILQLKRSCGHPDLY